MGKNGRVGGLKVNNCFRHVGEEVKSPYHYTECGLEDVYLVNGYEIRHMDGEEGVAVKHVDALHQAIGVALVTEKKILSGKELRFLRNEMDLTQAELGQLMGLTDQSVARWEKDQYEIPNAADSLLRALYLGHINQTTDLRELIESLKSMDSTTDERFLFKPTKDGWQQCVAA